MKPANPHTQSRKLRVFKPSKKRAGIFCISIALADTALVALAFFVAVSPFIQQPGVRIQLPSAPLSQGVSPFNTMIISITHGGWFYFNDERLNVSQLETELTQAALQTDRKTLIIEADERVSHGAVIQAWNAALRAGIEEISMATRTSPSQGTAL